MNNKGYNYNKNGGASITPKARPGIHEHRESCEKLPLVDRDKMGRYGVNINHPKQQNYRNIATTSHDDEGIDEVDNVLSKHYSPHQNRRKSLDDLQTSSEKSFSLSRQAQSLPTSSVLHSYYSEDNETSRENSFYEHSQNLKNASREEEFPQVGVFDSLSLQSNKQNAGPRNRKRLEPILNLENVPESVRYNSENQEDVLFSKSTYLVLSVVLLIMVASYGILAGIFDDSTSHHHYNTDNFVSDLNNIAEKYRMTDLSILQLQTGLSTIVQRQDTGSFIFAYKSNTRNFDQDELDKLMDSVAATASKYLRNNTVRHIVVDGSKLEMHTHSELINKYRSDVDKTGVMLVKELDEVPSSLAMAFHYYCDEFNPLVKKSAIMFTLDLTKCSEYAGKQEATHSYIEKCLKKKWSGVPKDNISPLLNRVVSTIIDVAD